MTEEHKTDTIIVEGTAHEWPKGENHVCGGGHTWSARLLATPRDHVCSEIQKRPRNKPEGILSPGASVKVREGMIFNVSDIGQS